MTTQRGDSIATALTGEMESQKHSEVKYLTLEPYN